MMAVVIFMGVYKDNLSQRGKTVGIGIVVEKNYTDNKILLQCQIVFSGVQ